MTTRRTYLPLPPMGRSLKYTEEYVCNFCSNPLTHVFCDLGHQPPSNSFLTKAQLEQPETYYPLKAYVCEKCWLVQVPETKKAMDIFNEDYVYFSSESQSNVQHAKEFADEMVRRFKLNENSQVMEIGSNDGYMLQFFKNKNIPNIGVDPSKKCTIEASKKGIFTFNTFFTSELASDIKFETEETNGLWKFDLICGINVLAHQPNINDFVEGVRIALKPDGVAVFEFPWLLKLVENMEFDTIYHEHFSYFSIKSLDKIFLAHGMQIFDIEKLDTHGGSLRIYIEHLPGNPDHKSPVLNPLIEWEWESEINTIDYYLGFQSKVQQIRRDFMEFIYSIPNDKVIVAYGAAAKGNTFLNYCGIHSDLIPLVVDRSPHKQDKYLPGSHIFVTNEEDGIVNLQPDYVLILAWNLKAEIMEQLKYVMTWGGKFVTAIPELLQYNISSDGTWKPWKL